MIRLCLQQEEFFRGLGHTMDKQVLFLSALFHDFGKIWDYVPTPLTNRAHWQAAHHKRVIHHISRSGVEWTKAVTSLKECQSIEDEVLHCILAHHGLREWGSPVFPWSREAWVLHLCDGLSARMNENGRIDLVHSV